MNAVKMKSISHKLQPVSGLNQYVQRIARQLLISQHLDWNGSEARLVVSTALMSLWFDLPSPELRRFVFATHRVGKTLEPILGLSKEVPWPIESIRDELLKCPGLIMDNLCLEDFIKDLASKIKGYQLYLPQFPDWGRMIHRSARQTGFGEPFSDLQSQLAACAFIQGLFDQRLEALVKHVETQEDFQIEIIEEALVLALTEYIPSTKDIEPLDRKHNPDHERLLDSGIDVLSQFVHQKVRADFIDWLRQLGPRSQRSIQRRLSMLTSEPLVYKLWVKTIHGCTHGPLFELKVIADGVHYRLVFRKTTSSAPLICAFGLRRDLDSLVLQADGLEITQL